MSNNTLYITFDGLSDPLGQSQILPYLIGIAAEGFHIDIISCEKNSRITGEENKIRKQIEGLPITWQYILYNEDGGIFSRFVYVRRLSHLADKIRKNKKIKLVHCRSYLASLIGLRFRQKYKIPFIFDMRGFWADERIDGKIWSLKKPVHAAFFRYFKNKEKSFLRFADAVISLTAAAVADLTKKFNIAGLQEKIYVIPCCTNTALFDPARQKTLADLKINSADHLLIYSGSIGTWYYTKEMIDCALVWKKLIPNIRLLILTKDVEALDDILKHYRKEDREIIVTASAEYREMPSYLKLAKASIFFIKPAYSKIASSPTKMAECWSMDLPIITNSGIGDNDLYFKEKNGGVQLNDFNNIEYEKCCREYLSLSHKPGHYRGLAIKHFDNTMAIDKYISIYKALTTN